MPSVAKTGVMTEKKGGGSCHKRTGRGPEGTGKLNHVGHNGKEQSQSISGPLEKGPKAATLLSLTSTLW